MKKKLISTIIISVLLVGTLAGCGGKTTTTDSQKEVTSAKTTTIDGYIVNETYNKKEMKSIAGNSYNVEGNKEAVCDKLSGMGLMLTKEMQEESVKDSSKLGITMMPEGVVIAFEPDALLEIYPSDEEYAKMSEQELDDLYEKMNNTRVFLYAILKEDKESETPEFLQNLKSRFGHVEKLIEKEGATYYFAYTDEFEQYTLTEDEKNMIADYASESNRSFMKDNLCLFTPVDPEEMEESSGFEGTMNDFSAKTMSGKDIDQSVFADYDITMVNIWATWCGFCVKELPDIQKLYEKLPENVNSISICTDASTETELAQSMIDDSGIKYETLIGNDELEEKLTQYCDAMPVTVFVDSNGNIVGDAQTGLPGEDVVKGYSELIDQALNEIGKGE